MVNEPKMKDSGDRRTFSTGAVRDRGGFKPRPDLISPHANLREGAWLAKGMEKYGIDNWTKGMPIRECFASLCRHFEDYKLGLINEDHLAAIRTNAGFMLHFEEEIKAGRMDPAIDDMPKYSQQIKTVGDNINIGPWPEHPTTNKSPLTHEELVEAWSASEQEQDAEPQNNEGRVFRTLGGRVADSPTFYLTGPMRGIPQLNFPAFDEVAKQARVQGLTIISPAELDREHGIDPVNDPASVDRAWEADPNLLQTIVQRDCEIIINLKKDRGDGLILVPKWSQSTGARAEVALALWLELKFKNNYLDDYSSDLVKNVLFRTEYK